MLEDVIHAQRTLKLRVWQRSVFSVVLELLEIGPVHLLIHRPPPWPTFVHQVVEGFILVKSQVATHEVGHPAASIVLRLPVPARRVSHLGSVLLLVV